MNRFGLALWPACPLLVAVLACLLPGQASARDFEFEESVYMPLSAGSMAIAVGDVNGDGLDDMALTNGYQSGWTGVPIFSQPIYVRQVDVYLQRADGSLFLASRKQVPASDLEFNPVRMTDLDGDGALEVVVGHIDGISILDWSGGGIVVRPQPTGHDCYFIVFADMDADHDQDVICQSARTAPSIDIFYGDGRGGFASVRNMPTSSAGAMMQMQVKDVTADGWPDLLFASLGHSYLLVYPHDGVDAFLPAFAYSYPPEYFSWPGSVEVIDTDADGDKEVIVGTPGNVPNSNLLVYRRGVGGLLAHAGTVPTKDIPDSLTAADIDRDGIEDLMVGHGAWDVVGVYSGQATGLSVDEKLWRLPFDGGANQLALGDINHDGCTDLVGANGVGYVLAKGKCKPHKAMGDFSGDWTSDLLWRNPATGQNAVWRSGNNSTQQSVSSMGAGWSIKAVGDFDGDHRADIAWHDATTGNGVIWKSGNSQSTQPLTRISDPAWNIVGSGDFNGDGKADLLWRNASTGANAIWKSGNFATQQAITGVTDANWRVVGVGDFNGDGKDDILWRHATSGRNAIWLSANSQMQQAITGVSGALWQVAGVGDFNGDDKSDIFWRHANGSNTIWRSGDYAAQQAVAAQPAEWKLAAIGEFNRDSRDDVVWRNATTGQNVVWRSADATKAQALVAVTNQDWSIVR